MTDEIRRRFDGCNCVDLEASKHSNKRRKIIATKCGDVQGCYMNARRNNMHTFDTSIFDGTNAGVHGLSLSTLIFSHLVESFGGVHVWDQNIRPRIPRKCIVNMQNIWPLLVKLILFNIIPEGSLGCDFCQNRVWPATWGGLGCDAPGSKCNCDMDRHEPVPTMLGNTECNKQLKCGPPTVCIPCVLNLVAKQTCYIRKPFTRKKTNQGGGSVSVI